MILVKTKHRIKEFIENKGITPKDFLRETEIKRGFLDSDKLNSTVSDVFIAKIIARYPEINIEWLLTGEGEMLKSKEVAIADITGGVPYWNLPVSAGKSVADITGGFTPDGYIKGLPGADISENILPVTGTSMEPEISSGALIGIRKVNNWEALNTERIYFIITQDDRMIKRIEPDADDDSILWCVSPNYARFKIYKADIIEIQRVCFVYNPK